MEVAWHELRDLRLRSAQLHGDLAERTAEDVARRHVGGPFDRHPERHLRLLGALGHRDEREDRDCEGRGLQREVGRDGPAEVDPPQAQPARGVAGRAHG